MFQPVIAQPPARNQVGSVPADSNQVQVNLNHSANHLDEDAISTKTQDTIDYAKQQ
jgi:hypothetical protein